MTPRTRLRRSALVTAAALVLSACGGGDASEPVDTAGDDPEVTESPTVQPLPDTTVEVPDEVTLTPPGTALEFGQTATVAHEAGKEGTVLGLTVQSARQGALKDFAGFDLDDPYKKKGSYYYVRVEVENEGEERLGGIAVPLWGVSGENTLLQAVEFTSSFKQCPTEKLPKKFKPGDTFKTCLVYLSPNKGSLEGVSYRPTEDYVPIEWEGKVESAPKKKSKGKNKS